MNNPVETQSLGMLIFVTLVTCGSRKTLYLQYYNLLSTAGVIHYLSSTASSPGNNPVMPCSVVLVY